MLFASEALVVVAFALEQLLEVGFAVKFALQGRKGAKATGREGRKVRRLKVVGRRRKSSELPVHWIIIVT